MKQLPKRSLISLRTQRIILFIVILTLITCLFSIAAYATTTNNDVAGGIQSAFDSYMKPQMKKIVNNVVFPIIDAVVAVFFVVKTVFSITNYRKNSGAELEWHQPAILLCALIISVTAPLWVWTLIKW